MTTTQIENLKADNARIQAKKEERLADQTNGEDCFVSEFAGTLTSRLNKVKIEILENGGKSEFDGLFTPEGERIAAKLIRGKWGLCWAICDDEGQFTGTFQKHVGRVDIQTFEDYLKVEKSFHAYEFNEHEMKACKKGFKRLETKRKNLLKKGFVEKFEMADAYAMIDGSGTGFSGLSTCHVVVRRADDGYPEGSLVINV